MNANPLARLSKIEVQNLLSGRPADFEYGYEYSSDYRLPTLPPVSVDVMPEKVIPFNDLGRSENPEKEGISFYKEDHTFVSVLAKPSLWVSRFTGYSCILTPDCSVKSGMEFWEKQKSIFNSRYVGAYFSKRGMNVVVHLRWDSSEDYELVCSGIPTGSVFAVSTYGLVRSQERRREFIRGLEFAINRLRPSGIMIYGVWISELDEIDFAGIEVRNYSPNSNLRKTKFDSRRAGEITLF